jgi:predicted LPLAT superfamily acyltransferase
LLYSRYLRKFLCAIYRVDLLSASACRQASLETFAQRLLTPAESIKNESCWTASNRFLSVVARSGHSEGAKLQGLEVSIMERFFKFARSSQPRASLKLCEKQPGMLVIGARNRKQKAMGIN